MRIKRSAGEVLFDSLNSGFLIFIMFITLYPFVHVLFASLSEPSLIVKHTGPLLYPLKFTLDAYDMVLKNPMISRGYLNTLYYVALGTLLNVLVTGLGAYVLSRRKFLLKKPIMFMVVFTMFFGGGLIPFYLQVSSLGLINTRMALILPGLVSTYNLIVMRTYFTTIPESYEESARMDGANDFTILFRVIMPMAKPIIAVMILFYGVGHWNSWFNAMIFLRKREMYPLQLILREILISSNTDSMATSVATTDKVQVGETIKYATIMVATIPILFIYPSLQKYFVKGIMIGGLKG